MKIRVQCEECFFYFILKLQSGSVKKTNDSIN